MTYTKYMKYRVRWVTKPTEDGYKVDMREGRVRLAIDYYEIVDMEKASFHTSDQVLHTTKDEQEAKRYADMLNKQHSIESEITNVRRT